MIRIYCDAAHAVLKETEVLTSGMTNYPQVLLTFSEDWDGMGKVAVCRAGPSTEQSVDVEGLVTYALGSTFVVPSECLAQSGVELYIGIQGVNAQAEVAIPTIWVSAGTIMEGVDIDEAINTGTATPTLVQQMIAYAGQMEDTAEDLAQNVIRQVLVNDTYANRYGTVDVELTDTGAGENRQLTFTFANLKGNGLKSIAFVSTGTNTGRVVVTESNGNVTKYDGIKDALEYVYNYIDHNVSTIITDYIELHPEYVTTVMDGAVSYQKLDTELQGLADIVRDLDTIPTRTSDLINDSNFVSDVNYVHTDSNYTGAEKAKLEGIEAGAQVNTITGIKGNDENSYRTGNVNLTPADIGAVPTKRTVNGKALSSDITISASDVGAVPTSRTINAKALTGNITLSAADVGAVPVARTVNGKALSSNITLSAADVSAVPTTRTVNSKALSADITLASGDIEDDSDAGGATVKASLSSLKVTINTVCLQAAVKTISANGTSNNTLTGLTANHVVGNWGMFSDSACTTPIPENSPTCDITITTTENSWSVTIANFTSTFYLKPTFILKQN